MQTILNTQKKVIIFQIAVIIALSIRWVAAEFSTDLETINPQGFLILVLVVLSNYFFYRIKYSDDLRVYYSLKIGYIIATVYAASLQNGLVENAYNFVFYLLAFELYISVSVNSKHHKILQSVVLGFIVLCELLLHQNEIHYLLEIAFYGLFLTLFIIGFAGIFREMHAELLSEKEKLEHVNIELNRKTAEIYTQNELLQYISSVLDITSLIEIVNDAILGTIGVDTCSLVLYNERIEEYMFNVKSNYPGDHLVTLKKNIENSSLQKYFESDKIHFDNEVSREAYPFIENRPVGSVAIIPLLREEIVYGLLIAEHSNTHMFTDDNLQFFTGIAIQITIAVNNANLYALMGDMAIRDGLTGIYNRKYLQDQLQFLIVEADQKKSSLSIALMDIDNFKEVNDQYGHLFGDEAIKMVAFMIQKQAVKHGGLAIRYGGEEFILVLPNHTIDMCNTILIQLHSDIRKEKLIYNNNTVVTIDISIGITNYPERAANNEDVLLRADRAMYYSKNHGRGRITIDSIDIENRN